MGLGWMRWFGLRCGERQADHCSLGSCDYAYGSSTWDPGMLDTAFANALRRTGFEHRANVRSDGFVIYRLRDRSGSVRLSHAEWEAIGAAYSTQIKEIRKISRRLELALFPCIFIYGMSFGQIIPFSFLVILLGIFGGPSAIYLWHSHKVELAAARAEAQLARFPRAASVANPVDRPPRVLQIAAMVLVGSYLIVAVIAQIGGPSTFRNTPLSGAHIGWAEVVAFSVLSILLLWTNLGKHFRR